MKKILLLFIIGLFLISGCANNKDKYYVGDTKTCAVIEYICPDDYKHFNDKKGCGCEKVELIGGQKDEQGCLTSAGYSWNEEVSACIREWEFNDEQRKAIKIVVMPMSFRPVTIVDVEKKDCEGCFIVTLGGGGIDALSQVVLKDWKHSNEGFDEEEKDEITNFEECIAAGFPALESYPRQCNTDDGKHFVEDICSELDQEQCEEKSDFCEAIFGSSQCNGDICTADYVFKGCEKK